MIDYLTVRQAAEALGMDPGAVRRAILQERLPARKFGRDWQIRRVDLEAYRLTPKGSGGRPRAPRGGARDAAHD